MKNYILKTTLVLALIVASCKEQKKSEDQSVVKTEELSLIHI